ncbi:MAG TPA: hypothetical protein DDW27_06935 [Bacteroidales bacterium]|nr:hypothetical protein [Bacteroidales bacterium]
MKKRHCTILLIITGLMTFFSSDGAKITAEKIGSKINVTIDGKFFTSYIFSDDEKYPFFFPVNAPLSGGSVTSMRNAIYPHHSSLFFGCDLVNGGNYWQEGLERGRIISVNARIIRQGGDSAVIADECIWSRPGATSPVKDTRKYTITSPSPDLYQIDVEISMEMLMDVHILKTNHSLFSVRMAADLAVTNGGTMINAEGEVSEKETFGKRSAWIDFYGKRGCATEGVAIMQHPSNPWYPSPWFTRDYGFMSPTPMFWPENGEETFLKNGTRLLLRYRVLVHGGTHIEARIEQEFKKYSSGK